MNMHKLFSEIVAKYTTLSIDTHFALFRKYRHSTQNNSSKKYTPYIWGELISAVWCVCIPAKINKKVYCIRCDLSFSSRFHPRNHLPVRSVNRHWDRNWASTVPFSLYNLQKCTRWFRNPVPFGSYTNSPPFFCFRLVRIFFNLKHYSPF